MPLALIHYNPYSPAWAFTPLAKTLLFFLTTFVILFNLALFRLVTILAPTRPPSRSRASSKRTHLLILLGSGGHTSELLSALTRAKISPADYSHRTYVISSGDSFSALRAKDFEDSLHKAYSTENDSKEESGRVVGTFDIATIPRARKIHQLLLTTPISALQCLIASLKLLYGHERGYPDLILTNGPGTAVILVFASLILRFFAIKNKYYTPPNHNQPPSLPNANAAIAQLPGGSWRTRTIFIESFARVKTLSLSGRILMPVVDRFVVQWKGLEGLGEGKAEWVGWVV